MADEMTTATPNADELNPTPLTNPETSVSRVEDDYGTDAIDSLEGMEAVRMRPAMYIGDTFERGFHHCVYEVVDNSIDEAMAGYCTHIDITINADGSCTVKDNGRGIPVGPHPKLKKETLEVVLTVLHAGGKFHGKGYKVSGGLHGVGVSCVNALSDWLEAEVRRGGKVHRMRFSRGKVTQPIEVVGTCPEAETGTTITFHLDKEIFHNEKGESFEFSWDTLSKRFKELSFLNPGVTIRFHDDRNGKSETYYEKDGIVGYVRSLTKGKPSIEDDPNNRDQKLLCDFTDVVAVKAAEKVQLDATTEGEVQVEIALQYVAEKYDETIHTFANNINTHEGGTHLTGFCTALTNMVNAYATSTKLIGDKDKGRDDKLDGADIRQGIVCVISVKLPNPQFEGQTKTKLGNSYIGGIVQRLVNGKLREYFGEKPKVARAIVMKAISAKDVRKKMEHQLSIFRDEQKKGAGKFLGKLRDCSSRNRDECELFLVEGDSAGGSATQGRDRSIQAILPLRGKVLNVQKARDERMLANNEIRSLISAIGGGFGNGVEEIKDKDGNVVETRPKFDVTKIRYNKIVIMTDADVDGAHIRTLLLTFFYNQMRPLIEHGHVYLAQPPLYMIKRNGKQEYIESDAKLTAKLISLGATDFHYDSADGAVHIVNDDMPDLMRQLAASEDLCNRLVKQNVDIRAYFAARSAAGEFPRFRVITDIDGNPVNHYVFRQDEVDTIKKDLAVRLAAALAGVETPSEEAVAEALASIEEPENPNFTCTEILQSETLRRNMAALRDTYGFPDPAAAFWGAGEDTVIGTLTDLKGAETTVDSLMTLLETVRIRGRKGSTIQRYKGLGEMDYDQLFDTTMDPKRRKLLRVVLDSHLESDKTFALLMGDDVPPRRRWIEENSLMANIDA